MKAIVTADWHIHPSRECSRDGGQDRLNDGLNAAKQLFQAARDRRCLLIVLGDLKTEKPKWHVDALNGLLALFREFRDVPAAILHGNHDGVRGGRSGLEAFATVPNVRVVTVPGVFDFPEIGVERAAWWPAQPTLEKLPALLTTARRAGVRVLFGHAFLGGAVVGPEDVRLQKGTSLEVFGLAGKDRVFDWAFLGDVHKRQAWTGHYQTPQTEWAKWGGRSARLPSAKTSVMVTAQVGYPGSPYAQNWGELELNKGGLYVDLEDGVVEAVLVKAPRFRVVDLTSRDAMPDPKDVVGRFPGMNNARLERMIVEGTVQEWSGDFVRLLVGDWASSEVLGRVRAASGARYFEVVVRKVPRSERRVVEIHSGLPVETLLERYVKARPPEGLDLKAVLAAGRRLVAEE